MDTIQNNQNTKNTASKKVYNLQEEASVIDPSPSL